MNSTPQAEAGLASSPEGREYFLKLRKGQPFGINGVNLDELRAIMATRREPTLSGTQCIRTQADDIPCEWVMAPGADPDVRLLYLHGGGYVSGSGAYYVVMAAHISAAAKCAVLLPDYRLAPEHRFPAAIDDCVRAHEWMTTAGPTGPAPARTTFIAGDSAGGGLTLATLLALRGRKLKLPAGGIALSPFADMTMSGASTQSEAANDPIMSPPCLPAFVERYLDKSINPRTPLASPVFADYSRIPPLLIQVGEHEIIRDDSVRVAARARADGVAVTLEIWPGMFHVFQSHEPLIPEARDAIGRIASFMQSCQGR
jgi:acetyl esterase/lipase